VLYLHRQHNKLIYAIRMHLENGCWIYIWQTNILFTSYSSSFFPLSEISEVKICYETIVVPKTFRVVATNHYQQIYNDTKQCIPFIDQLVYFPICLYIIYTRLSAFLVNDANSIKSSFMFKCANHYFQRYWWDSFKRKPSVLLDSSCDDLILKETKR
jgi:hypothetical protein